MLKQALFISESIWLKQNRRTVPPRTKVIHLSIIFIPTNVKAGQLSHITYLYIHRTKNVCRYQWCGNASEAMWCFKCSIVDFSSLGMYRQQLRLAISTHWHLWFNMCSSKSILLRNPLNHGFEVQEAYEHLITGRSMDCCNCWFEDDFCLYCLSILALLLFLMVVVIDLW